MTLDLKHLNNIFINTDENIHSVSYGFKIINGLITNKLCVQYYVLEKKKLSELNENQVIPKQLDLDGQVFETDVIQLPIPLALCSISNNPSQNQLYRRPIRGGTQIATNCGLGTMGFVAVDNQDNTLVGVTNLHVISCSAPYETQYLNDIGSSFGKGYHWFNDAFSLVNYVRPFVYQDQILSNKLLGIVKRSYMLKPGLCYSGQCVNYIDAALLTLPSSAVTNDDSWKQIGLTGLTTPPTFASTNEINSLLSTRNPMYSSGRTTGPKGEGLIKMYAFSIGNVQVGYQVPVRFGGQISYFDDIISCVASGTSIPSGTICSSVVRPGDSGSMVYAFFDGVPKIVGLVFAASSVFLGLEWSLGLICRIDRISNLLNISPWSGDSKNCIDNPSTSIYQVPYLNTPLTISLSGNTYWQAGSYNININKTMASYYKFIPNL